MSRSDKRIGIKAVAERAGVHFSTASRALDSARSKLISEDVVSRVRKAAEDLGYQPNAIAAGLRTSRSRTIGVMVPDLSNSIFPPIFRGIEDRAAQAGYTALLANSDFDPEDEMRIFDTFLSRQVDGLIMATTRLGDPVVERAREKGLPVVSVLRSGNETVSACVGDTYSGIGGIVRHLHGLGHRNIVCIAGPQDTSVGVEQADAFRLTMKELGVRLTPGAVLSAEAFSVEGGRLCCRQVLNSALRPTAIVAGGDLIALGCLDIFGEFGLTCPDDISLTGYNDMPYLDRISPPLTTVRLPFYEMGFEAMGELLTQIEGGRRKISVRALPVQLVIRSSTSAPPEHRAGRPVA